MLSCGQVKFIGFEMTSQNQNKFGRSQTFFVARYLIDTDMYCGISPLLFAFVRFLFGSTSIVGVEKKEIVSSSARSTLGTAFMCGKTGYVF